MAISHLDDVGEAVIFLPACVIDVISRALVREENISRRMGNVSSIFLSKGGDGNLALTSKSARLEGIHVHSMAALCR